MASFGEKIVQDETFVAQAALTRGQIVKHGTADDTCAVAADSSTEQLGVAHLDCDSGDPATIATSGVVLVLMSASGTRGDKVTATTGGKGVVTVTDHQNFLGYLDANCPGADVLTPVRIARGQVSA